MARRTRRPKQTKTPKTKLKNNLSSVVFVSAASHQSEQVERIYTREIGREGFTFRLFFGAQVKQQATIPKPSCDRWRENET
jgi:hypothetical protein